MAIEATITGNLGADPDVRWTQGGQQVTELRICATPRRQRRGQDGKPTGEWEDAGEPLWVRAASTRPRGARPRARQRTRAARRRRSVGQPAYAHRPPRFNPHTPPL